MLVILNYVFDITIFSFLIYFIHLNHLYKKEVETEKRNLINLQILMDLSEEGWIVSKRSMNGWIIQQASEMFCKTLGYDWTSEYINDVIGLRKNDLVNVNPLGKIEHLDTVVSVYINQLRKKDGKEIWVETSGTTIFLDSGDIRITLVKSVEHIISKFKDNKDEK